MTEEAAINCRKAAQLLSLASDRQLSTEELQALEFHLQRCGACRNFQAQLRLLHDAAKSFGAGG
jgi:predicted anti-sigma-YlaC factor YlaD